MIFYLFIDLDFRKRWCTLENGSLSYFDNDKVVGFCCRLCFSDIVNTFLTYCSQFCEFGFL